LQIVTPGQKHSLDPAYRIRQREPPADFVSQRPTA
jgi:hypothetical protein